MRRWLKGISLAGGAVVVADALEAFHAVVVIIRAIAAALGLEGGSDPCLDFENVTSHTADC